MVSIKSGLTAGFISTFAISAIIQMKNATKSLTDIHLINAWGALVGAPTQLAAGWIVHFTVGVIFGGIGFAFINPRLPSKSFAIKGAIFGILMWLVIMLIVMPLSGGGAFATNQSHSAPFVILVLYLTYGLILGKFYGNNVNNKN